MKAFLLLILLALAAPLFGRTWTSSDGNEIEAELVRVDGDQVVLSMKGREYTVPLSRLSEDDRGFIDAHQKKLAEAAFRLGGTTLKAGQRNQVELELSEDTRKALSGNKLKPTRMKLVIELPADFDPNQPQRVFWSVGGINNERERLRGNIGAMGKFSKVTRSQGWILIAADTEHGNPRETTIAACRGDTEFHQEVVDRISGTWPEFRNWEHACGGNSSGAKGSFFRVAHLRKAEVNVVGAFIAGCNQCMAVAAEQETGVRSSKFNKVKAWISTGDQDHLVNAGHVETVKDGADGAGYGKVRAEGFEGGHSMSTEEFGKALAWFVE